MQAHSQNVQPSSLSNHTINAIQQDRSGTLWLGTRGGLNRFDPATSLFTAYLHNPDAPDSLVNDGVFALADAHFRQTGQRWPQVQRPVCLWLGQAA